jgi:hypothetical protein
MIKIDKMWINIDRIISVCDKYVRVEDEGMLSLDGETVDDIIARIRVARRERLVRHIDEDYSAFDKDGWGKKDGA